METRITPRFLDWALNGVPVYLRRRPADNEVYATTFDFSRYLKEPPLETVRVTISANTPRDFDPCTDPKVVKRVKHWAAK